MEWIRSLIAREKRAGRLPRAAVFGLLLMLCGSAQIGMIWNTVIILSGERVTPAWVQWMHDALLVIGGSCSFVVGFQWMLRSAGPPGRRKEGEE